MAYPELIMDKFLGRARVYCWEKERIRNSLTSFTEDHAELLTRYEASYLAFRDHHDDEHNIRFWRGITTIAMQIVAEAGPSHWRYWREDKKRFYRHTLIKILGQAD
ncbi:hypothetical protein MPER_12530 [Moniliophthora perniciosa FA553]|nr:hypothetical protein MPER_12530 [Moniliophthora perniciosa FA553]